MANNHFLVFGGARSGKSSYALGLADRLFLNDDIDISQGLFVATARALDEEMRQRIHAHRKERGRRWHTLEEGFLLAEALQQAGSSYRVILIDCLTMWLSNLLLSDSYDAIVEIKALADAIRLSPTPVILVSNEVGMGLVPEKFLGRRFRDIQGRLNQDMAQIIDTVVFMAAGLPLILKGTVPPL